MGYLVAGLVIFLLLAWLGRGALVKLPTWRLGSTFAAIVVFAVAAYMGLRGSWPLTLMLSVIGIFLALSSRTPRGPQPGRRVPPHRPPALSNQMSAREARDILGVGEDATVEDIQTAYKRLMVRVHPDNGGAPGLAVQLNAARDRLLKGPRP